VFTLGRQPGCDLVFDGSLHPEVAPRHCEIVFDHQTYLLRDRSRAGTFVNERPVQQQVRLHPGDWIRLGPDGPLVRFLGQTAEENQLGTTA
jgi:pSer/pThr/pTyr-binding forkhead associated (FHA) protein